MSTTLKITAGLSAILIPIVGTMYLFPGEGTRVASNELAFQLPASSRVSIPASNLIPTESTKEIFPQDSFRTKTIVVAKGDTLSQLWEKVGATRTASHSAAAAFKAAGVSPTAIRVGEKIEFKLDMAGNVAELKRRMPDGRFFELKLNQLKNYEGSIQPLSIIETPRTVSGGIYTSIAASAADSEVPYQVIDDLVDILGSRVNFSRDLQPGDTFVLNFTERKCRSTGELLEPGPITSVSIENDGKFVAAIRHAGKDGIAHYFDESGKQLGDYFLRYPLKFTRISSVFTKARFHPVLQKKQPHNGVDFAAPSGTAVRSIADGVITFAGYNGGAGNMIRVQHTPRYATAYMHLQKLSPGMKIGSRVTRAQVIGSVGMTGLATGPHLHFSLYDKGKYVDPMKADLPSISTSNETLPKDRLESALLALKQQHHRVLMARLESPNSPS